MRRRGPIMGRPKSPDTSTWECPKCGEGREVIGVPLGVEHRCPKVYGRLVRLERKGESE